MLSVVSDILELTFERLLKKGAGMAVDVGHQGFGNPVTADCYKSN
jgi:hypothetical protein